MLYLNVYHRTYISLHMKIYVQESKTILHLMFLFNCDLIHGHYIYLKKSHQVMYVYKRHT